MGHSSKRRMLLAAMAGPDTDLTTPGGYIVVAPLHLAGHVIPGPHRLADLGGRERRPLLDVGDGLGRQFLENFLADDILDFG